MGFQIEFNWALKLKQEQGLDEKGLKEGLTYNFSKRGNRIYPLSIPIDLINNNWEAVAKVLILEFRNMENRTEGKYKIIRIYKGEEKEFITNYWRDTVKIIKGKDIDDFSDIKIS